MHDDNPTFLAVRHDYTDNNESGDDEPLPTHGAVRRRCRSARE